MPGSVLGLALGAHCLGLADTTGMGGWTSPWGAVGSGEGGVGEGTGQGSGRSVGERQEAGKEGGWGRRRSRVVAAGRGLRAGPGPGVHKVGEEPHCQAQPRTRHVCVGTFLNSAPWTFHLCRPRGLLRGGQGTGVLRLGGAWLSAQSRKLRLDRVPVSSGSGGRCPRLSMEAGPTGQRWEKGDRGQPCLLPAFLGSSQLPR